MHRPPRAHRGDVLEAFPIVGTTAGGAPGVSIHERMFAVPLAWFGANRMKSTHHGADLYVPPSPRAIGGCAYSRAQPRQHPPICTRVASSMPHPLRLRAMSSFPDHLQALLYPRAYPHPVRRVELIE